MSNMHKKYHRYRTGGIAQIRPRSPQVKRKAVQEKDRRERRRNLPAWKLPGGQEIPEPFDPRISPSSILRRLVNRSEQEGDWEIPGGPRKATQRIPRPFDLYYNHQQPT